MKQKVQRSSLTIFSQNLPLTEIFVECESIIFIIPCSWIERLGVFFTQNWSQCNHSKNFNGCMCVCMCVWKWQFDFNIYLKCKKARITKTILRKNKVGSLPLLGIKAYCKATKITTVWYYYHGYFTETELQIYVTWYVIACFMTKVTLWCKRKIMVFSINDKRSICYLSMEKVCLDPYITIYTKRHTKINSKWIKDFHKNKT